MPAETLLVFDAPFVLPSAVEAGGFVRLSHLRVPTVSNSTYMCHYPASQTPAQGADFLRIGDLANSPHTRCAEKEGGAGPLARAGTTRSQPTHA